MVGIQMKKKIENNFKKVDKNRLITTTKEGNCFALTTRCRGRPFHKKQDNYIIEECISSTQKHSARTDGTYSQTLTEAMGRGESHVPMVKLKENEENKITEKMRDYRIRKLTPVECERLQGFPDDWTKYGKDDELISDTQRYKCCGNAVTTNVITAIVDEMFDEVRE